MEMGAPTRLTSTRKKLALSALLLGLLALLVIATLAAFSSVTSNPGNTFAAGTVVLADNDSNTAMFNLSNAKPGDTDTACINVVYSGTLPANVRIFGTTAGTGLDQYLTLTVTRGIQTTPAFDSCTGFTPDTTNYIGAGAGVIYNGNLQGFADDYAAGIVDPVAGSPEAWTNPENHLYRFVVTLQDNNLAQGKNATQTFTWEARNS